MELQATKARLLVTNIRTSFFSISPRNVVASSEVRRQLSTIPDRLRFKQLPTVYAGENVFSRERSDIIIAIAYAQ